MASALRNYRYLCATDGGYVTEWREDVDGDPDPPVVCKNGAGHAFDAGSVSAVDVVEERPRAREDGVAYSVPKPSLYGTKMCDRDFRIRTSIVDGNEAIEDVKMNPLTNLEVPWNELAMVGVYKDDGSGGRIPCMDQADADANAVLSVFSYCAKMPGTETAIAYEVRDGMVYVDPAIFVDKNAPTELERFGYRAYAIIAPQIPGYLGGSVAVFDGYMGNGGLKVTSLSPQAEVVSPSGPGGLAAAELRLYLVYPPGSKLSHIFRLVTYREPGTF